MNVFKISEMIKNNNSVLHETTTWNTKANIKNFYVKPFCNHVFANEYLMETSNYVEARRYAARLNKNAVYKAGIEVCAMCDTFLIYTYEYKERI